MLLTISHPDIDPPIRVVNNTVDITSQGNLFMAFPFEAELPDSPEDAPPRARLRIDNVSREIGQTIRLISSPATVSIQIVRQGDLDTIEAEFPGYRLSGVRYDALTVEGDLTREDLTREVYPFLTFSPAEFPGLIK
ncbi:MAG TPA: DUF1833 family protein [Paracoccaceae bacterium]|nr:DUF1833 family protein [Paracoccaceae bacterium]